MPGPTRSPWKSFVLVAEAALVAAALLAPARALAATESYTIDPNHSAVGFKIRHLFSRVPGRFTKFEGTIRLDQADLSKGSVQFTIQAASIDTDEPARDKHLRSDAFFDVENHPKITFQSTRVKNAAPNKLQVDGNLTIRGTTKPVTLDVDVLGFGPGLGAYRAGFEARTRINRQDFGVKWNDIVEGGGYVLGDDVDITINIEAARDKPKAAGAETKGQDATPGTKS
jgi:polyisoprenoid-binding protein YceI